MPGRKRGRDAPHGRPTPDGSAVSQNSRSSPSAEQPFGSGAPSAIRGRPDASTATGSPPLEQRVLPPPDVLAAGRDLVRGRQVAGERQAPPLARLGRWSRRRWHLGACAAASPSGGRGEGSDAVVTLVVCGNDGRARPARPGCRARRGGSVSRTGTATGRTDPADGIRVVPCPAHDIGRHAAHALADAPRRGRHRRAHRGRDRRVAGPRRAPPVRRRPDPRLHPRHPGRAHLPARPAALGVGADRLRHLRGRARLGRAPGRRAARRRDLDGSSASFRRSWRRSRTCTSTWTCRRTSARPSTTSSRTSAVASADSTRATCCPSSRASRASSARSSAT